MGNKPAQPIREDSRTQLQTAETLSATPVSSQQQQKSPTRSKPSKTGSTGSSTSNSRNSKQEGKKKNKLRKKRLPFPKLSQPSTTPTPATATPTPSAVVIQQTTQSVTGSDPNLLNQNQQTPEYLKKDATIEEQLAGGGGGAKLTEVKASRKSKSSTEGKKNANRTTTEEGTVEKDAKTDTVEKTTESPAPGTPGSGGGGLAKRKKYKISGPKPKDENTEFERIKTKARPARQRTNSQLAGTRNLAKMMEKNTKEEISLKSFEEEEELVTARLEPTQQVSDTATTSTDNKTSGDATTPEKSAEDTNHAHKRSDYL